MSAIVGARSACVEQQVRRRYPTMGLAVYARALASKPRRQHVHGERFTLELRVTRRSRR